MRWSSCFRVLAMASFGLACSSSTGAPAPAQLAPAPQGTPAAKRITVTNDAAALAPRLHVSPHPVGLRPQGLGPLDLGSPANPPTLQWIGQLDPPQAIPEVVHAAGTMPAAQPTTPMPLLAVTVAIGANVALVTYILTNDYFAGAVDVLDITNVDAPVLRSSAIFEHMNITSAVFVPEDPTSGSGTVYVSGSTCDPVYPGTALVERLRLDQFQLDISADYRMPLFGGSGESVTLAGDHLFGTAGLEGGVRMFDANSGAILAEAPVDNEGGDGRWVSVADGRAAVVSGGKAGRLDVFNSSTLAKLGSYPFDGASIPASKSTVQLVGGRAFIAAGPGGVQVLSAKTGKVLGGIPVPANTGYLPEDVVTNAVSIDGDLLFIANGGPGVYVAQSANPLQGADSEAPFSAAWTTGIDIKGSINHVAYRGNALIVASGTEGTQILRVN